MSFNEKINERISIRISKSVRKRFKIIHAKIDSKNYNETLDILLTIAEQYPQILQDVVSRKKGTPIM